MLYLSQHTDYTSAERCRDVDNPAKPVLVEAASASDAMDKLFEAETDEFDGDLDDLKAETTLVLLDTVIAEMRRQGWIIVHPSKVEAITR